MLEVLETPRVEGGVGGADSVAWTQAGGGVGVGFCSSGIGAATFARSFLESRRLISGGSELFRKLKSMSSFTSCSLFLGLTKLDELLMELAAPLPALAALLGMLAVPASRVALDLLMFPAAAAMKLGAS